MSEAKKKKTLKEIPEEELAQISGGAAYYETKWVVTEGNTDINQQGGGVSGSNNGGEDQLGKR